MTHHISAMLMHDLTTAVGIPSTSARRLSTPCWPAVAAETGTDSYRIALSRKHQSMTETGLPGSAQKPFSIRDDIH
jgi:hypothetical protein